MFLSSDKGLVASVFTWGVHNEAEVQGLYLIVLHCSGGTPMSESGPVPAILERL